MIDFKYRCKMPAAREGSTAFYVASFPPNGLASVDFDSSRWLYLVRRGERREFRRWLADVFGGRVSGRYPVYDVKRES